ncbi:RnfABCDGE type electron transport complex subunit D [Pseudodesulfovibrio thermohalotolerans]|uniref:RnfABCDGE type electron transport complex subunit D n=1 Tax=Pseudodesulfovibrio thermohalotolerans TaxID=2880651 RepID=UPI002442820D|nr:RnfABCDGE type electron transport complex subunit D [Pseudodesulfovibrio thermohalotolerans]WFS63942.1 RnfABCDGE type electron transport complex subunit D [Pseudodesulfovibrio thermohalotolerans]
MNPPILKAMSDISLRLTVSPPPHWRSGRTIQGMMQAHLLALIPAAAMAAVMYGWRALSVVGMAGTAAVLTEVACLRLQKRDVDVDNYSALYAGVLFAFLLPATAAWWLAAMGGALTIALGRAVFGGFGCNPVCAPLVAWAVCRFSWPEAMDIDLNLAGFMANSPVDQLMYFGVGSLGQFDYMDLFMGRQLGGLGSSQVAAVAVGGLFLLAARWIRLFIPFGFLAGVAGTAAVYRLIDPTVYADPVFHLLAGSTMFGAFFLATDTASSPVGKIPQIVFGLIAGAMVVVIRAHGVYPDGVPFAIMVANLLSPLLERLRPKYFGVR